MKRLVVVGNGMAGVGCIEQILKYGPQFDITIFGDETHVNYNRIMLSSVLAGEKGSDEIALHPLEWYRNNRIDLRLGVQVRQIPRRAHRNSRDARRDVRRSRRPCARRQDQPSSASRPRRA